MNLKQYIFFLLVGSIISWCSWILIIIKINPYSAGIVSFSIFYAALFLSILGTVSVLATIIRNRTSGLLTVEHIIYLSLRQGTLIAILILVALYLSHIGYLSWWMILILLFCLGIIEYIFLSFSCDKNVHKQA